MQVQAWLTKRRTLVDSTLEQVRVFQAEAVKKKSNSSPELRMSFNSIVSPGRVSCSNKENSLDPTVAASTNFGPAANMNESGAGDENVLEATVNGKDLASEEEGLPFGEQTLTSQVASEVVDVEESLPRTLRSEGEAAEARSDGAAAIRQEALNSDVGGTASAAAATCPVACQTEWQPAEGFAPEILPPPADSCAHQQSR